MLRPRALARWAALHLATALLAAVASAVADASPLTLRAPPSSSMPGTAVGLDATSPPHPLTSGSYLDEGWLGMGWTPDGPDDLFAPLLGSTLEVVRTQATYFTRSAAFGPRVTDPEGLRGTLIPISAFRLDPTQEPSPDEGQEAMYACPPDAPPTLDPALSPAPPPPHDWIALVERGGNCSFVDKVRLAQSLGATAVVVGDAPNPDWDPSQHPTSDPDPGLANKRLVTMFASSDASDVVIPSAFITRPSFLDLRRLIYDLKEDFASDPLRVGQPAPNGIEIILSQDDTLWEWPFIHVTIVLLPLFMTLVTISLHRFRRAQLRRAERAPKLVVDNLPCLIVHGNGVPWEKADPVEVSSRGSEGGGPSCLAEEADVESVPSGVITPHAVEEGTLAPESLALLPPGRRWFYSHECAICLGHFIEGDRVRVLPCGHIFHQTEIDGWLLGQKGICPVCKCDVTQPFALHTEQEDAAGPSASAPAPAASPTAVHVPAPQTHGPEEDATERTALLPSPTLPQ